MWRGGPFQGKVFIGGHYTGDRIVLRNTANLSIVFVDCIINSTHPEDALVFADTLVAKVKVEADQLRLNGGGLTFWGKLRQVSLRGGTIANGHTGIRATQDLAHRHVKISDWTIQNMTHEGIYFGISQDTPEKVPTFISSTIK